MVILVSHLAFLVPKYWFFLWAIPIFVLTWFIIEELRSVLENTILLSWDKNKTLKLLNKIFWFWLKVWLRKVKETFLTETHNNLDIMVWRKDKDDYFTMTNKKIREVLLKCKKWEEIGRRDIEFVGNEFWEICESSDTITKDNYNDICEA